MGKPFRSELESIPLTLEWATNQDQPDLVQRADPYPLVCIGSGGSTTAAVFAAQLRRAQGATAWACTPMEYGDSADTLGAHSVLLLTARGNNRDAIKALGTAVKVGARQVSVLAMSQHGKIVTEARQWPDVHMVALDLPTGKDGYLATNSLIATIVILAKSLDEPVKVQPSSLEVLADVTARRHVIALYGGWSSPAAIDLESKLSEAGLASVMLCDYRNFAHGRHHWLAKHGEDTAIIAFATRLERRLAARTLALIPESVPRLLANSEMEGPSAGLQQVLDAFRIVDHFGAARGIDPGRPGVPEFGSKLYHLSPGPAKVSSNWEDAAISRKLRCPRGLLSQHTLYSSAAMGLQRFREKLEAAEIAAVVLDYDGTICAQSERYEGMQVAVGNLLNSLIEMGLVVGIATGRGKSVACDLRKNLPKESWARVLMGYYNGSQMKLLDQEDFKPATNSIAEAATTRFAIEMRADASLVEVVEIEERPNHISITFKDERSRGWAHRAICEHIARWREGGLKLFESGHSVDVFLASHSKKSVAEESAKLAGAQGKEDAVLCIGDSGCLPGNDFELLDHGLGLSVGSVSASLTGCWNMLPEGISGVAGVQWYLQRLTASSAGAKFHVG